MLAWAINRWSWHDSVLEDVTFKSAISFQAFGSDADMGGVVLGTQFCSLPRKVVYPLSILVFSLACALARYVNPPSLLLISPVLLHTNKLILLCCWKSMSNNASSTSWPRTSPVPGIETAVPLPGVVFSLMKAFISS